jgi:hypothetical protein
MMGVESIASTTVSVAASRGTSTVVSLTGAALAGGPTASGGALIVGGAALGNTAMSVPASGSGVTGEGDSEGVRGSSDEESSLRRVATAHGGSDSLRCEDRIGGGDGTSGVDGGGDTRGSCGFAHGGIGFAAGDAFDAVEE